MSLLLLIPVAFAALPIEVESDIVRFESARAAPAHLIPFANHTDHEVRARAAVALGRLRTPSAIHALGPLAADPDVEVRVAAAFALSQTPGSRWLTRQRLQVERDTAVRKQLLFALGLQGVDNDVALLMESLAQPLSHSHPGDEVAIATQAIGRLAMRGMRQAHTQDVVRRLIEQHRRLDVRVRRAAAFSLARITPMHLPPELAMALIEAARDESDATAQAWLVRATAKLQNMHTELSTLYTRTAKDPDPSVRIATVRAGVDAGWTGAASLLHDDDPEVRLAAIAGMSPVEPKVAMSLLGPIVQAGANIAPPKAGESMDPRLASAVAALKALDRPEIWFESESARYDRVQVGLDPSLSQYMAEDRSIPIRVAAVSIASDPTTLMGLALGDPLRRIRTTAATRLLDGPAGGYRALSLLNSTDVMVHVAVCEYLISHPNPKTEDTLVAILKGSESRDLVRSAAHALARLYQGRRRGNPSLAAIVPGLLAHEDAGIRGGGAALARSLGLSDAAKVDPAAEIPLADVHTIRGAVVETSFGPIVFQLFPEDAPLNVWNFAKLAESGFYDGLSFHRVVPDFVVQGGDPRGDGWGGPGYTIPDEVTQRSHTVGALGMALSGPDTGGSQWYVTLSPQPHLDGQYTIFGQVTQGQHVLQSMLPGDEIRSIRVERVAPLSERRAAERLAGNESYTRLKNNTPPKKRRPRPAATKEIKEDEDLAVDPDLDDAPDYLAPKEKDAPLIQTERVEFDAEDEQEAPAEEDTDEDSTDEDTDPDDD